ncbi:MAG TPA: SDR family oxidoreductase [Polyangiaceae bacterium]|jgi:NAD(P)-dependent dehydrogenase (short-subunit alcohol dehydrogenase family)
MEDRFPFGGRVVVVTGGARGIGRAIAHAFLESGASVVVCGRNANAETVRAGGAEASYVAADVREPEAAERVIGAAVERYGRVDVLVNNAGGSPFASAATASPRFSAAIVSLNLLAPLSFAQRANAVMQGQADGGVILNIASVSGTRPSPGTAVYGAAKAGLLSLTQSLAIEWAPKVRVNAVTPGLVLTEEGHLHYGDAAGTAAVSATIPIGRMATPRDVAEACLLLASPRSGYITGASLLVHGGGERPAFLGASTANKS